MGRQLGRGLREFKKATSEIQDHFDLSLEDKEDKPEETPLNARPTAATTVPVAEASVAQAIGPEAAAAPTPVPQAAAADAPEVVEGEVVHEEADQPAEPVAG
jgi:Sec-independent protein translocase protein TatA